MIVKTNIEIVDMPYKELSKSTWNKRARTAEFTLPDTRGGRYITSLFLN